METFYDTDGVYRAIFAKGLVPEDLLAYLHDYLKLYRHAAGEDTYVEERVLDIRVVTNFK